LSPQVCRKLSLGQINAHAQYRLFMLSLLKASINQQLCLWLV